MKKEQIRVESVFDTEKAVSYLSDIVSKLRDGRITIEHGEHALTLEPHDPVTVKIKASRKPGKESISLKISWKTDEKAKADETTDINISSKPSPSPAEEEATDAED